MRISYWSSDVGSSDLTTPGLQPKDRRGCGGEPDAGAQGSLIPVPPGQPCGPQIAPRHVRFLALATTATAGQPGKSEGRRVGKERVRTCRSRWSPEHKKKHQLRKATQKKQRHTR